MSCSFSLQYGECVGVKGNYVPAAGFPQRDDDDGYFLFSFIFSLYFPFPTSARSHLFICRQKQSRHKH